MKNKQCQAFHAVHNHSKVCQQYSQKNTCQSLWRMSNPHARVHWSESVPACFMFWVFWVFFIVDDLQAKIIRVNHQMYPLKGLTMPFDAFHPLEWEGVGGIMVLLFGEAPQGSAHNSLQVSQISVLMSIKLVFEPGKKTKITKSQIWAAGGMGNHLNATRADEWQGDCSGVGEALSWCKKFLLAHLSGRHLRSCSFRLLRMLQLL